MDGMDQTPMRAGRFFALAGARSSSAYPRGARDGDTVAVFEGRIKALTARGLEREDEDEDSTLANAPAGSSPCGRGQGEGVRLISNADGDASSPGPHPDPFPGGEGVALEIRNDAHLLHSACISRHSGMRTSRAA